MRDTRNGRAAKTKEDSELPGVWVAYGTLLQHLCRRAELNQQALGEAIGYSLEQVASVEQGRRPAKEAFTVAAERVLAAGGVLAVLQGEVDRAKLPRFFRGFALIEAEVLSRFSYDPPLVPGLLQTEAYARAVFAGHCPPFSLPASRNSFRHFEIETSETPSLRAASAIVASPASTDSTMLISFAGAICGGLSTMATSLAQPVKPLLTGMPEAVTRDRGAPPQGPGDSTQDRTGTVSVLPGARPRSPADREHWKDLRRGSR